MGTTILSPTHIMLVLVVALLVFGPKRLPAMGRAIGEGLREFKGGISTAADEAKSALDPADPKH
jgi:sec-independent protein translocase protein TatA